MKTRFSIAIAVFLVGACMVIPGFAQYSSGIVNSDDINIRCDSNVSSALIAKLAKGQRVEILQEKYDWYKIRLPRYAPAYIKKQFVEISDKRNATVTADKVNIRLTPNDGAAIIGRSEQGEPVEVLAESGQWYKIEPVKNSYGWAHKQFITAAGPVKMPAPAVTTAATAASEPQAADITCEGILQPTTNKRFPFKLVTKEYSVYLVKPGSVVNLEELAYQKIRILAKSLSAPKEKYPAIEAVKAEPLE